MMMARQPATTPLLRPGTPAEVDCDTERLRQVADQLTQLTASGVLTGAGLVVARRGVIVLETAAGWAQPALAQPANLATYWLLASITKPVAATAIMLLVERGQLSLDEPVAHWLPEFGTNGKEWITTRHLLTHTAGIDERAVEGLFQSDMATAADLWSALCASAPLWPAGSRAAYNNVAFHLLARLIERLTGEPHPRFIERELFVPLGLTEMLLGVDPAALDPRLATVDDVEPRLVAQLISSGSLAGGLVATAGDVARFGQWFLSGGHGTGARLLAPASRAAMLRDYVAGLEELVAPDHWQPAEGRGLAWRLNHRLPPSFCDLASPAAYGHGGATGTLLLIDPTYDLVVAFMANRWAWPGTERRRLLNHLYSALR